MEKRRTMKTELKPYQLGRRLGSGVIFQLPKHQFKYGEQTTLPMNGINIDTEGNINIELLLPDGDLLFSNQLKWCKPVLRPLSSLTIPITHNGETFVPIEEFEKIFKVSKYWYAWNELIRDAHASKMDYRVIQWLIAHNFHIDEPLGTWISVDELETNPYEN
jgi:hypothetical protein